MSTTKILLAIAVVAALIAVPWFMRSQRHEPVPAPVAARKPPAPSKAKAPAPKSVEEPAHDRFQPLSAEVQRKADAFILLVQQELPKEEMMQRPEMREFGLKMLGLMAAMSPETKERMTRTVKEGSEAIKTFTGNGMGKLDPKNVNEPAGRGFVEAVFSGEPERLADWTERMTGEVIAETALDPGLEKTSSGITIQRKTQSESKTDGPAPE